MKTYKQTIEKPRIEIMHDEWPQSPREWSNLGYFITCERDYVSPDGEAAPELQRIIADTGEQATNLEDHIQMIKDEYNEDIVYITPVYRYEHGAVLYKRGTAQGFDCSNCGFYIVTADNDDSYTAKDIEKIEAIIDGELEIYTKYANGEVYMITIYDEDGELQDSCGGFYDIEDMRDGLPTDLQNEDLTEYIIQ